MVSELTDNNDTPIIERRQRKRCPECQWLLALAIIFSSSFAVLFLFNIFPHLTDKGDFQILSVNSYALKENIVIDADLKMHFPDPVVDALENGIPLTIAVDVQVLHERPWWRNRVIKRSAQRFELRYHPLTNVHEVKNIATEERYSFNSRQDAMAVLGTIRSAVLIGTEALHENEQYAAQIRIFLDISHLPPALRQIASLSSSWRLESTWYQWQIGAASELQSATADTLNTVENNAVAEPGTDTISDHEVKEQKQ